MPFAILLVALSLALHPAPQILGPDPAALAEMAKLNFLVGNWEGEGWMDMGTRNAFRSSEIIERKLGGMLLLIEGKHFARMSGQQTDTVVHHALAIISWDPQAKLYRFRSNLANGRSGDYTGIFNDGAFIWHMTQPQGQMRYTIRLNDEGQWFEIGERSTDGATWTKFFEMTLTKSGA